MNVWIVVILGAITLIALIPLIHSFFRRRLAQQQRRISAEALPVAMRAHLLDALRLLARSVVSGQISLCEASIRISWALEQLHLDEANKEKYLVFYQLAQAQKKLPRRTRKIQLIPEPASDADLLRIQLEQQYHSYVISAAKELLNSPLLQTKNDSPA